MLFGLKHALKFTATLKASALMIPKRTALTGKVTLLNKKNCENRNTGWKTTQQTVRFISTVNQTLRKTQRQCTYLTLNAEYAFTQGSADFKGDVKMFSGLWRHTWI